MKALRPLLPVRFKVMLGALALDVSGCGFPMSHPTGTRTLFVPMTGPSVLVLITNPDSSSVQEWLITHGIAASRLQAFGYGETDPLAPNTTSGQPLNRRVVVVIDPAVPP